MIRIKITMTNLDTTHLPYLVKDTFEAHVAGWNDRVEVDGDGEEEEENRRVVTIARSIFIFPT